MMIDTNKYNQILMIVLVLLYQLLKGILLNNDKIIEQNYFCKVDEYCFCLLTILVE
jgi:hypothetical protein